MDKCLPKNLRTPIPCLYAYGIILPLDLGTDSYISWSLPQAIISSRDAFISSCFLRETRIVDSKAFRSGFLSKRTEEDDSFSSRAGIPKSPRVFSD